MLRCRHRWGQGPRSAGQLTLPRCAGRRPPSLWPAAPSLATGHLAGGGAKRRTLSAQIPPPCWKGSFLSLRPTDKGSVFSLLTVSFSEKWLRPAKNLCYQLGQPLAVLGCSKFGGDSGAHTAKPSCPWLRVRGFVRSWPAVAFREPCLCFPAPHPSPCVPQLLQAAGWEGRAGPSSSRKAPPCLWCMEVQPSG